MKSNLDIRLDRAAKDTLNDQLYRAIGKAIRDGRLDPGARLPSWRDLAAQLGVARGTVRTVYDRLADEQLIVAAGAAGTFVTGHPPPASDLAPASETPPLPGLFRNFGAPPLPFQPGVPAQDAFPFKLWSRISARSARQAASAPVTYPDPRGQPGLRREIAAYLAIARGMSCSPSQIIVTGGYSGALGLALRALPLKRSLAWMEDPGFPLTRAALEFAGHSIAPVPLDDEGLDVAAGTAIAADAGLAVVTPGQQAPLGVTLSLARRIALLDWADRAGAWIIEDDYLSELHLKGRAAPALAAQDRNGRVVHIGSFSKTITPSLRLGFLVVPKSLAERFADVAASLAPAPNEGVQNAVAAFMAEGHYLRHLRRMKRIYAARRDALIACLRPRIDEAMRMEMTGSLAVRLILPQSSNDVAIAAHAPAFGLAPAPLSPWHVDAPARSGLMLAVTNLAPEKLDAHCTLLLELIRRYG